MSTPEPPPAVARRLATTELGILYAGDPANRFEVALGRSIRSAVRQARKWADAFRRPVAFRFNGVELTARPDEPTDLVAAYYAAGAERAADPARAERLRCRAECLAFAAEQDEAAADPAREDGDRLRAALRAEAARELAARLLPPGAT